MFFITSFSAVMVLLWDHLLNFGFDLNKYFLRTVSHCEYIFYISRLFYFSFPIFGLLADVWIGRHKAIVIGMILSFLSWIITGIGYIIQCYNDSRVILWLVYGIAYFTHFVGIACFTANIIQYTIDQLVGASADELNTVIYWHCATLPIMSMLYGLIYCFDVHLDLALFIVSGVVVSLVLVSHSLFKHKLENISLIKNPIKLIVRVLCYARKHKYPENRSALTYWEEEAPSRLDLGKGKYGGPFTEEEVEDVKTIFRMLPLFIAIIGYAFSEDNNRPSNRNGASLLVCLLTYDVVHNLCSLLLLIMYLYFIRVFFSKCIPSMLARMSIGLLFAFLSVVSKILPLLSITWKDFISELLLGLAYVLINPVSLEFAVAQSPVHSRGIMVGVWYASWEVGSTLSICINFIFDCHNQNICSSFYYYLTKASLLLIILTVFVILAIRYRYRVRENEVNIHQIVDGTYQNYIQQEEEYKNDNQS